tara:strand:+ start:226 stop:387 length:162 start_codon:yes stop_codon:yes gene_type:complete
MIKSKKGSTWIWIIIILVLIAVGIGVYFWLSGGDTTPASNGGISIPTPPKFPS